MAIVKLPKFVKCVPVLSKQLEFFFPICLKEEKIEIRIQKIVSNWCDSWY